jgi:hypothetical protein
VATINRTRTFICELDRFDNTKKNRNSQYSNPIVDFWNCCVLVLGLLEVCLPEGVAKPCSVFDVFDFKKNLLFLQKNLNKYKRQALWSGPGDFVTLRQVRAGLAKCRSGCPWDWVLEAQKMWSSNEVRAVDSRQIRRHFHDLALKISELIKPESRFDQCVPDTFP